jgi:hypothetical protein
MSNAGQGRAVDVPERTLRRLAEASLAEAQLSRISHEVADLRGRLTDLSAPNKYLTGLQEQRAALLAKHAPAGVMVDVTQQRLDRAVLNIGDLLFPWSVLELPYMTDGIYDPPGTSDVTGDLVTAGLYAGGLGFGASPGGVLTQGNGGTHERWWTRTWRNSVVFPPAPFTGRLYYRFGVNCECNIYRDPVETGSIHAYVTIGTASDTDTSIDEWTNWQTVGWPIIQSLPIQEVILDIEGGVSVTGSIPVTAGNSCAMAFIYGIVISIAGGLLMLLYGDWGTGIIGGVDYTAYDKIQYRFEPDWWIQAISGRLENAPPTD